MAAKTRTQDQILADTDLALSLSLQKYTYDQIQQAILKEHGHEISISQIKYDLKKARKALKVSQLKKTEKLQAIEMARLDELERLAWEEFRRYRGAEEVRTVLEREAQRVEGTNEHVLMDTREKITREGSVQHLAWFDRVVAVQKERRRLLGLYSENINLNVEKKETRVLKAYISFDPGQSWPAPPGQRAISAPREDIVDGEYTTSSPEG